jgi:hypothetical protein
MRKKEMIEVTVIYCDHCGKKIEDHSHTSANSVDGVKLDFHSTYIDTNTKTCWEEFRSAEIQETLRKRKIDAILEKEVVD